MKIEVFSAGPEVRVEEKTTGEMQARLSHVGNLAGAAALPVPAISRLLATDEMDRRLGVSRQQTGLPQSKVHGLLGLGRTVPIRAIPVDGKVSWVNYDLARRLGYDVPHGNRMTPEFHKQLIERLSFRALPAGHDAPNAITMEADRYGGSGLGTNGGAGRAAFLSHGNLNIKGIGLTPLAVVDPEDYIHSHGGAPMREGFLEAIWGEVNQNLFSAGSTQILAIIDTGDATPWADGTSEPRALIVRAGRQFRPAHLVNNEGKARFAEDAFIRAARDSGDLVEHAGTPDLDATMRNVIVRHARTAAEQVRWRILHGATSTSNMELDGSQLDLGTQTSQPRTAPIKVLSFTSAYGKEHVQRGGELTTMYSALLGSMSAAQRKAHNATRFSVQRELSVAYEKELKSQYVQASGIKSELAAALRDSPQAETFAALVQEMAKLKNRGSIDADKNVVEDVAVLDVFNLLRHYPALYFANPSGTHLAQVKALLQPFVRGGKSNQYKRARQINELAQRFSTAYADLMKCAADKSADFYDQGAFQRSVTQRAAFENAPLDKLYRAQIKARLDEAITKYRSSNDSTVFKEEADQVIASSLRSTEGLLAQGHHQLLGTGGVALEQRTISGIDYSVRAWTGGAREVHLEMAAEGDDERGYVMHSLPGTPHLHRDQIEALRYRFSTDGWKTWQEAPARLEWRDGKPSVSVSIPVLSGDTAQLQGLFHCTARGDFWLHDGAHNFSGYVFTAPDDRDLKAFLPK